MRRSVLLIIFLLAIAGLAQEKQLYTAGRQLLVPAKSTGMNSELRRKLELTTEQSDFNGGMSLPAFTPISVVKVVEFNQYRVDPDSLIPDRQIRAITAAFVKLPNGESGWLVLTHQDKGQEPVGYLTTELPPPVEEPAAAPALPDLSVGVSRGDPEMQMAGKEVLSVQVFNSGTHDVTKPFTIVAEVNGKQVKTKRVWRLPAGGSHYFNVEVPESGVRRGYPFKLTVDPENKIEEADESNNIESFTL